MDEGYLLMRNRARRMRTVMTPAEQCVWKAVRKDQFFGFRFRRQEVFGQYIADFYCSALKLVLEIDGGVHELADVQDYDRGRTETLQQEHGVRVLRLPNEQVLQATPEAIRAAIQAALTTPPPTPPSP